MIRNFKDSFFRLFNINNLYSFILVVILFGVQLFYRDIPGAMLLSAMLATGAIFIHVMEKRTAIKALATYAVIGILYAAYLLTTYRYLTVVIYYSAMLWAVFTTLKYLTHENYTEMLKLKLIRGLIALVYFAIVYASIFIIVQLLNSLFSLDIVYNSWPFRLSNAIAFSLGLLVLMYEKVEEPGRHSEFFRTIIGKIMPMLTILMAVLSIALVIKQYMDGNIPNYMETYYLIFGWVLLAYVLSEVAGTPTRLRQIVGILMAISILTYSLYHLENDGFFSNYGIAINVIVAIWLFYHVARGAVADWKLSLMQFIVAAIILAPPFGYMVYKDYRTMEAITAQTDSILKQFQDGYNTIGGGDSMMKNVYFNNSYEPMEINISEYNFVAGNINIDDVNSSSSAGGYTFKLSEDRRVLSVVNNSKNINESINIYDLINAIFKESPSYYRITREEFMLDIINYSYYEYTDGNRPAQVNSYMSFDIYYK